MGNGSKPEGAPGSKSRKEQRHDSHAGATYAAFIKDLAALGNYSRGDAGCFAASVLCVLEQRLYGGEPKDLEAQLPAKVREFLTRCPRHQGTPPRKFGREEFLRMVAEDLVKNEREVEPIVRNVFAVVRAHISPGEAEDVKAQLPKDLQDLWA